MGSGEEINEPGVLKNNNKGFKKGIIWLEKNEIRFYLDEYEELKDGTRFSKGQYKWNQGFINNKSIGF